MTKGFALVTPTGYHIQFGAGLLECAKRAQLLTEQNPDKPVRVAHCRFISPSNRKVIFSELGDFVV